MFTFHDVYELPKSRWIRLPGKNKLSSQVTLNRRQWFRIDDVNARLFSGPGWSKLVVLVVGGGVGQSQMVVISALRCPAECGMHHSWVHIPDTSYSRLYHEAVNAKDLLLYECISNLFTQFSPKSNLFVNHAMKYSTPRFAHILGQLVFSFDNFFWLKNSYCQFFGFLDV